jgi:hypothetical protein
VAWQQGQDQRAEEDVPRPLVPLTELIDEFLSIAERQDAEAWLGRRYTEGQLQELRGALTFADVELGGTDARDFGHRRIQDFVGELAEAGVSETRLNTIGAALHALYGYRVSRGIMHHTPMAELTSSGDGDPPSEAARSNGGGDQTQQYSAPTADPQQATAQWQSAAPAPSVAQQDGDPPSDRPNTGEQPIPGGAPPPTGGDPAQSWPGAGNPYPAPASDPQGQPPPTMFTPPPFSPPPPYPPAGGYSTPPTGYFPPPEYVPPAYHTPPEGGVPTPPGAPNGWAGQPGYYTTPGGFPAYPTATYPSYPQQPGYATPAEAFQSQPWPGQGTSAFPTPQGTPAYDAEYDANMQERFLWWMVRIIVIVFVLIALVLAAESV